MILSPAMWAQFRCSEVTRLSRQFVMVSAWGVLMLPADAETLGMRRPPAYVGHVQTEAALDPATVTRRSGEVSPLISTATQVPPPADPEEPLFRELPPEGSNNSAQEAVVLPPAADRAKPLQHDNKVAPSPPRVAAKKAVARTAKVLVEKTAASRQPGMKVAPRVRSAKVTTQVAMRTAKQKPSQATQKARANKDKARVAGPHKASRRVAKIKPGTQLASAKPSRAAARPQKAKATSKNQARAVPTSSTKHRPRAAASRKEPQGRRLATAQAS